MEMVRTNHATIFFLFSIYTIINYTKKKKTKKNPSIKYEEKFSNHKTIYIHLWSSRSYVRANEFSISSGNGRSKSGRSVTANPGRGKLYPRRARAFVNNFHIWYLVTERKPGPDKSNFPLLKHDHPTFLSPLPPSLSLPFITISVPGVCRRGS